MSMRVDKAWGFEEVIVNNAKYCGKILHLDQGAVSSLHYHKAKLETFYVLGGKVELQIGLTRTKIMNVGDSYTIEPGMLHRFRGLAQSLIVEFSTPHSDADVFRKELSQPAKLDAYIERGADSIAI